MIIINQLTILLIAVILLLLFSMFTTPEFIVSPQFGFTACFIPGIIYAFWYINKWDLNLSINTVKVIIIGIITFIIISILVQFFYIRFRSEVVVNLRDLATCKNQLEIKALNEYIPQWKIGIILFIQFISLILVILFLIKNFGTNLSASMFAFRQANIDVTSDNFVSLPGFVRVLRRFSLASSYVIMYLFTNGIIYKSSKNMVSELLVIMIAFLNSLILGGRGDAIQLISIFLIIYLFNKRSKYGKLQVKFKSIVKYLLIAILILFLFVELSDILGRQMSFLNFNDYVAVYLSAELKNLDIFIRSGVFGSNINDSQTFANISTILAKIIGNPEIAHHLNNPFNYINGYALGNVSTTFYAFLYDGGYAGLVGFTALFSFISQMIFQKAKSVFAYKKIYLSIILYAYVWYTVIFSFFSDKFYEMIFNTAFIWTLFSWIIVIAFLNFTILHSLNIKN